MSKKPLVVNCDFLSLVEGRLENIRPIKKSRKKRRLFKTIKFFGYLIVFSFLVLLAIILISAFDLKIMAQELKSGRSRIEQAMLAMEAGEFAQASVSARSAEGNFSTVTAIAGKFASHPLVRHLPLASREINNFYFLGASAQGASLALAGAGDFGSNLKPILNGEQNFNALDMREKIGLLKFLYESGPELNGLRSNIELSLLNAEQIKTNGLLFPVREEIAGFQEKILSAHDFLSQAVPLSETLPYILGYPEKRNFLVLIQNNTELRPTGGFIGTYGIIETALGELIRYDTHDVYHLDMPVKDKFRQDPPDPLKKYLGVDNWYFRDSNWSPDWPSSARKAEWFFYKENELLPPKDQINKLSKDFDGVIALNPDLVISLLKITGPIEAEGEIWTPDNFMELLEYRVEKGYVQLGVPSWHRKEVIGQIAKAMKYRLFDLSAGGFRQALNVLSENLRRKNLLVYLKDRDKQEVFAAQNWDGSIVDSGGDYFFVVDANMAAFKTDAVMQKKIHYHLSEGVNGVFSDLSLIYKHNGSFDWKTTRYQTYTRIYLPFGSRLISQSGFESLEELESEFGKTVLGGYLVVEPGAIKEADIRYKLPAYIENDIRLGRYRLYAQKQPGADNTELGLKLDFNSPVADYYPKGFYIRKQDQGLEWLGMFEADREMAAYFE